MENIDEEWKEIWKSEYLKTIAAFHNTVGGRFIVGRRDNGTYIGVSNPHDVLKAISDSIRTSLGISVDIRIQSIEGKMCIVADVLGMSSKTVNRNLKVLHGLGLVVRDGERSHVRWSATIGASDIEGSD